MSSGNSSKRNSSRISSSSSASSSPANPPSRDGEGAADVQAENARRRQRRARENEIGGDNLDDGPPQGGGGLSVVSRRGLSPSRQGRQSQQPADGNDVITHNNVITNWSNFTLTEMNPSQVQRVLDCRITGEANSLLYAHPFRTCFTTASAQFLCNIFATRLTMCKRYGKRREKPNGCSNLPSNQKTRPVSQPFSMAGRRWHWRS